LPITGSDVFGREEDIAFLDDAWANQHVNVVTIVAWAGVGKSTLVNHWLQRMAADHYRSAQLVFGWSFYRQGTSGGTSSADEFLEAALVWFGDPDPRIGTGWEKGERLAKLIAHRRTLLVLDGLEPLQNPPGPQEGRVREPALQALLRELAAFNAGLCVITTRMPVADITDHERTSALRRNLEQLSSDAGAKLLRALGVKGDEAELRSASEEFSGHCFSLTLLGSYLTDAFNGDIRFRKEISESLSHDVRQGIHARKVMESYQNWLGEGPELSVLRMLGLFVRWARSASGDTTEGIPWIEQGIRDFRATGTTPQMPIWLALKAEALHLADRTSEALEAIREAEGFVEKFEVRWWSVELHRLRAVFLTALGAEETQIEASLCAAIRIAREQKSISLEKRAEATYAEYRRQKASGSEGRGFRLPL